MRTLLLTVALLLTCWTTAGAVPHFVIVEGLGGAPEYDERFQAEAARVAAAARRSAGDDAQVRLLRGADARRENLIKVFTELRSLKQDDSLAVILIGHGTYDGDHYKLNIPGPDLTAS